MKRTMIKSETKTEVHSCPLTITKAKLILF